MSTYTRKTRDEWTIQGHYGQGWEDLSSYENRKEARADLRAYDQNERGTPHRLVYRREKIETVEGMGWQSGPSHNYKGAL